MIACEKTGTGSGTRRSATMTTEGYVPIHGPALSHPLSAAPLALIWQPYFPPAPLLAAVAVLLGLALLAGVRSFPRDPQTSVASVSMRCLLIAALGLLLLGPATLPPRTRAPGRPTLTVMVDTSGSMQTPDVAGLSRYDFAARQWLDPERLAALRRTYDVQLYAFDEQPRAIGEPLLRRPAAEVATARVSNIARSVSETIARIPTGADGSAVLLLSDGRDTRDEPFHPVGRLARARSIPVHTVALGGIGMQQDLALVAAPMQEYLLAGEPGRIAVRLALTRADAARTTLHVRCGDEHTTRPIAFEGGDGVTIDVPIRQAAAGLYEYRITADPIPGEIERANNAHAVFVPVTSRRLRVLLLEGQPYWDTKFLAQTLRKDERLEVTQITQLSTQRQEKLVTRTDAEPRVPGTLTDLTHYDVVVLGRAIERVLPADAARLLPEYVSAHGGRVVFARGRAHSPDTRAGRAVGRHLAVLEPAAWVGAALHDQAIGLEPAGRLHPCFSPATADEAIDPLIDALPPLRRVDLVAGQKPAVIVLARTRPTGGAGSVSPGAPVLTTMQYGRGMVLAVLGEGLWKWRLRRAGARGVVRFFDRFWSDMVRWLAMGSDYEPGAPMSLRLSRRDVQIGDAISFDVIGRVDLDELDVRATVIGPTGDQRRPALVAVDGSAHHRRATMQVSSPGVHRVVVQTALAPDKALETRFNCIDVDLERLQSGAAPSALRVLSDQSGGRCVPPHAPDELPPLLARYRAATIVPPRPRHAWDRGWILTLILAWAGGEWLIRKKGGLL